MRIEAIFEDNVTNFFEYVKVNILDEDGVRVDESNMTLDEFVKCIMGATFINEAHESKNKTISSSPFLPKNCFHFRERVMEGNTFYSLLIEVPKRKWDIMVYNTFFLKVGFPRLVFLYNVDALKMDIKSIEVFALKSEENLSEDSTLFKFPFSNVSNGVICLGPNKIPKIKNYGELENLHTRFMFNSPFTDDFYTSRNLSKASNLRELAQKLTKNDFPDEWLLPKNKNIGDLLK